MKPIKSTNIYNISIITLTIKYIFIVNLFRNINIDISSNLISQILKRTCSINPKPRIAYIFYFIFWIVGVYISFAGKGVFGSLVAPKIHVTSNV